MPKHVGYEIGPDTKAKIIFPGWKEIKMGGPMQTKEGRPVDIKTTIHPGNFGDEKTPVTGSLLQRISAKI